MPLLGHRGQFWRDADCPVAGLCLRGIEARAHIFAVDARPGETAPDENLGLGPGELAVGLAQCERFA
jgi:hypothetical protein